MIRLPVPRPPDRAVRILCVGAHSDDIEIGCGGTMLRLLSEYEDAEVHWVVLSGGGARDMEARASAARFMAQARKTEVIVERFQNSYFPYIGAEIKRFFEELKRATAPDIIFTHYRHDLHQDHRLTSELTWNTYRDHLIFEYEVLKYDGDLGSPNLFVHLSEQTCREKIRILLESFTTQADKDWFTADAFSSLLRIRGVESRAPERYAEAFYARKAVL